MSLQHPNTEDNGVLMSYSIAWECKGFVCLFNIQIPRTMVFLFIYNNFQLRNRFTFMYDPPFCLLKVLILVTRFVNYTRV